MTTEPSVRTPVTILDLTDVNTTPSPATAGVGGKAAGLAALLAAGERTPPGFVVPHDQVAGLTEQDLAGPLDALGASTVAVRSSGVDEDGAIRSLAGAHDSILGVAADPAAVLGAAHEVHASGTAVAVVVQPMVDAAVSGVAFSVNPVSGDDEVVISAVAGLGDRLVAGEVEGETWVVRGEKVTGDGSTLTTDRTREIASTVRRLAAQRGYPVDVEWCLEHGTGSLVLLQCRPVTAVPVPPTYEVPPGTWEKDVAHSPGPLSPMTTSLDMMGADMFSAWTERFGFIVKGLRMEYFGGEEYSQVVPVIGDPAKPGGNPPWWLLGVLSRIVPPVRRRMKTAEQVLASGLLEELPQRWEREWKPEFEAATDALRATDVTALDDTALIEHAETALARLQRGTAVHFDLFVPYLVDVHAFVQVAERRLGWDSAQCLGTLAGASPASWEATRRLDQIAGLIAARPAAVAVLEDANGHDLTDLVSRLRAVDPPIADAVQDWIDVEGFRTTDYDVASPTVAEIPGLILQLLRGALGRQGSHSSAAEPDRTLEEAVSTLDEAGRSEVLAAFERARAIFGLREENVRLVGLVPIAAVRRAVLEMGRRLTERGVLGDPEMAMMLLWPEVTDALRGARADGTAPTLDAIARRRQAEHAWVQAHPGPLFHGPAPIPPPDLRGLPAAGRTLNQALMWAISEEMSPPPEAVGDGVRGTGCGSGTYTGPVRVVRSAADFHRVRPGDVLVCPIATPAWAALFSLVGAVVCDGGGALSHTAIVAREHGLPTVMGTSNATERLVEGQQVRVDGATGTVTVLED